MGYEWQRLSSEIDRQAIAPVVAALSRLLTRRLVALIAGASETQLIARWEDAGEAPPVETQQVLRAALVAATLITTASGTATAQRWFLGKNRALGDAPSKILRTAGRTDYSEVARGSDTICV